MHINISGKGVHRREIPGVDKLRSLPSQWYAFTNLELIQTGAMPRQIDLVIVVDDRLIIADLKDWSGKITSDGDRWFQNGRSVDTSPVKKILENARIMATLLSGYLAKSAAAQGVKFNRWEVPLVEGCVILTGRCDISQLPDLEKPRVFPIDEFCRIVQDQRKRNHQFAQPKWIDKGDPYTASKSRWRPLLGNFFGAGGGYFKQLDKFYGDYRVVSEKTYEHPKSLYSEYDVEEATASRASGLLRLWDFSKAESRYASEEARAEIAGREQNVIAFLIDRNPDLETVLIRPKVADRHKGIHYWEVFEKRRHLHRLREFVRAHAAELTPTARIHVARTLLSHVAAMHRLGAAHLDLGAHSIWLELPSVIRLSHLVAAAYPELGSLGDRRYEFLGNATVLPESILGGAIDHLRKDVFLLGVVVHSILFGAAPIVRKVGDPPTWDPASDHDHAFEHFYSWFEKTLDVASAQRFANAQEMLDAFNEAVSRSTGVAGAVERLQRYRRWKSMLELSTTFPARQVMRETDRIIAWRSEVQQTPCLVKAWRRACWGDECAEAPRLVRFCEAAEDLILAQPRGLVRILDVGYLGDHLVLVQEFVDAPNLADHMKATSGEWKNPSAVLEFLDRLANLVVSLHDDGRSHGDLKPANILVVDDNGLRSPMLVDLLDFGPAHEGDIRTPAYSPTFPVGSRERDRFAVLRIAEELLQISTLDATAVETITHSIGICQNQAPVLATLSPLLDSIARLRHPAPAAPFDVLTIRAFGIQAGRVASDEGRYYVRILDPERIAITGATEELVVILNRYKKGEVFEVRRRSVQQSKVALAEKRATSEIRGEIRVEAGARDYSALASLLQSLQLDEQIAAFETPSADAEVRDQAPDGLADSVAEDAIVDGELEPAVHARVDVPALWRTLLQVEEEQFTEGIADQDSYFSRERRRHFVPFQGTKGTIDFTREDRVVVEVPTKARGWVRIGLLDLDLTRNDLIAVDASMYRARDGGSLCSAGAELRFRSMMETDSRSRRNAATSRLLSRKSVVPDLIDYFEPASVATPREAPTLASIEEVSQYYGLNSSQSSAFLALWSKRPLGLLQGPPGTGKTKFIAALVHHALRTGTVRNVLLASQSHEAVNNAAEGVLKLFRKENREPSLVRIGQEGNVSDLLKPYHSAKVEAHYRERFRAGLKERFKVAGKHIGLPEAFTNDLFFMESTVWPAFRQLQLLLSGVDDNEEFGDRKRRAEGLQRTLVNLEHVVGPPVFGDRNWNTPAAYDSAVGVVVGKYEIDSLEQVRKLRGVASLARDWMGSVSSRRRSFEEFLAKTRHIVCGTCVGLGRSSLGLTSAHFDLVVVDEAARCTPSELAVPMQAGRWIVLVGDHLQLEPFHEPAVIRETRRRLKLPVREVVRSDFERAFASQYGHAVGESLLVQYRMLPAIGRLVSNVFYRGKLEHGRSKPIVPDDVCPEFFRRQLCWISTDGLGEHAFQVEEKGVGKSLSNPAEANSIVDFLRRLDEHQPFVNWLGSQEGDVKPIGIICTYAAQRELIRQKLRAVGLSGTMLTSCKIDTVDSYQGKENPIVILSLVRNNADGPAEVGQKTIAQGFLSRPNRVNVALSRAMDRLVIVGASQRWPHGPMARLALEYQTMFEQGEAEFVAAMKSEVDVRKKAKGKRRKITRRQGSPARGRE